MDDKGLVASGLGDRARSWGFPEWLCGVAKRQGRVSLLVFGAVVVAGAIGALACRPEYLAIAKVLVAPQFAAATSDEPGRATEDGFCKTQAELAQTRRVLARALQPPEQGGDFPGAIWAAAGQVSEEHLRAHLAVEHVPGSRLLHVQVRSADRQQAAHLANAVAFAFQRCQAERRVADGKASVRRLADQMARPEQALREAERALDELRQRFKLVALSGAADGRPALALLAHLKRQLATTRLERTRLTAEFEALRQATPSSGPAVLTPDERVFSLASVRADPTVAALRARLIRADKELTMLSGAFGHEHEQVRTARAAAETLRKDLRKSLQAICGGVSGKLRAAILREMDLEKQHDEQNQSAQSLAGKLLALDRLRREAERQRGLRDALAERVASAGATVEHAASSVEVVEEAQPPSVPVRDAAAGVVAWAIALGLVLGIAVACVREHFDERLRTAGDVARRARLPVLGCVPGIEVAGSERAKLARRALVGLFEPGCAAAEVYHRIRTRLAFAAGAEDTRLLVVTSASAGAGKTTAAASLALAFAQSGERTLLVEAELHQPTFHHFLDVDASTGLSRVLAGECRFEDAVQQAVCCQGAIENLALLPAGPRPEDAGQLLLSKKMSTVLKTARRKYKHVVIDTPAALGPADAAILAAQADGVVLVLRGGVDTAPLARQAVAHLEAVQAPILGCILSHAPSEPSEAPAAGRRPEPRAWAPAEPEAVCESEEPEAAPQPATDALSKQSAQTGAGAESPASAQDRTHAAPGDAQTIDEVLAMLAERADGAPAEAEAPEDDEAIGADAGPSAQAEATADAIAEALAAARTHSAN